MENIYIALENIRSLHNVGAVFRTCSFYGLYNILLVGYSGKSYNHKEEQILHDKLQKTSLGADADVSITFVDSSDDLIRFAKEREMDLVVIEQGKKSVDIAKWQPEDNIVVVFGNEVEGVSNHILEEASQVLEISRKGKHKSLNVTTACGIVLQKITS